MRKRLSELPHHPTDLAQPKTSEKRQGNVRSITAEYSDELGVTPASYSRRSTDSHLGRTLAQAYPNNGEGAGCFGVEFWSPEWPTVSSGAAPAMALRRSSAARLRSRAEGGRRRAWATGGREWPGSPSRRPDQGVLEAGHGALLAGVRPPRGRHWLGRGASARGREGRGSRPGRSLGRKGGGVGPAAPAPFHFVF